jgi:hypothetical protein
MTSPGTEEAYGVSSAAELSRSERSHRQKAHHNTGTSICQMLQERYQEPFENLSESLLKIILRVLLRLTLEEKRYILCRLYIKVDSGEGAL